MSLSFIGLNSVANRTIFTKNATIVKPPEYLLAGNNLNIIGPDLVEISTASFTKSSVGYSIIITKSGEEYFRNGGTFGILEVRSPTILKLKDANFSIYDQSDYVAQIVTLTNSLKHAFNRHVVADGVHLNNDYANEISTPDSYNLATARALYDECLIKITAHTESGPVPYTDFDPSVDIHYFKDPDSNATWQNFITTESFFLALNKLRSRYDDHRQNRQFHVDDDFANSVLTLTIPFTIVPPVRPQIGGPLTGPLDWVYADPRNGVVADDPSDVEVKIDGTVVPVDAVFGALGAVVLTDPIVGSPSVTVSYDYISNPPTTFERLNSWEFVLNQEQNNNSSGLPGHKYRQRSYLISQSSASKSISSPFQPKKIGHKFKAFERATSALLNDPTSLLLNVPTNRISYPVFDDRTETENIRYDPTSLPENSSDAWRLNGNGVISVQNNYLVLEDPNISYSSVPGAPFYSHPVDLIYPSYTSAVFRFYNSESKDFIPDGVFTGVGFGVNNGQKTAIVGCLLDEAKTLDTALVLAASIKKNYNSHLINTGVHRPNDISNQILLNDPYDLDSLLIFCKYIKNSYNNHLTSGPNVIHQSVDIFNQITTADPTDVNSAVAFVNSIRTLFNKHREQSSVHYFSDSTNIVPLVKQVGIQKNGYLSEESGCWESIAFDWSIESIYRLFLSPDGDVALYLNGSIAPSIVLASDILPNASDQDLDFHSINQAFFGSLSDRATSKSFWKLVRINIIPVDSQFNGANKSVIYTPTRLPDEVVEDPWISIGQSGESRLIKTPILLEDKLQLDSMSFINLASAEATGIISGEFRGYLRVEPTLTPSNVVDISFDASCVFRSFGIDNRSLTVNLGDGDHAVMFAFLQANPSPATVISRVGDPNILVQSGDSAVFSVNDGVIHSCISPASYVAASDVADLLNSAAGFNIASVDVDGYIVLSTQNKGSSASINVYGGSIFRKIGIDESTYFGRDSNPEKKISWTGMDLPDLDAPSWDAIGEQSSVMLNRTLQINDLSNSDFKYYLQDKQEPIGGVISIDGDWKLDARMKVVSYIRGDLVEVESGLSLYFCGAAIAVDEGSTNDPIIPKYGRSITLHLAEDQNSTRYINVLSFNPYNDRYNQVGRIVFNWFDGNFHNYNIFKNKSGNLITVTVDSDIIATYAYSDLEYGVDGPSITFGSASKPAENIQIKSSQSVTQWTNVSAVADTHNLSTNRYVGIYKGGDASVLSSYYTHQIDWSSEHSYRIIRDPVVGVMVHIDNAPIPSISTGYDVLTLPIESTDFISKAVPSGKFIAFGSFSPFEISRSRWGQVSYSIGRPSQTSGYVPPHQVLNKSNVMTSGEHLKSNILHDHYAFTTYSGGTPTDDFLSNNELAAETILGDRTPTFEDSQDLQTQGGLKLIAKPVNEIASADFFNTNGDQGSLENDTVNSVTANDPNTVPEAQSIFVAKVNEVVSKYNSHVVKTTPTHQISDTNIVPGIPVVTYSSALTKLSDFQSLFPVHKVSSGVHFHDDLIHPGPTTFAATLSEAVENLNGMVSAFNGHLNSFVSHNSQSVFSDDLPDLIALTNDLIRKYNSHIEGNLPPSSLPVYHGVKDVNDLIPEVPLVVSLPTAVDAVNALRQKYNNHIALTVAGGYYHAIADVANQCTLPNAVYSLNSLRSLLLTPVTGLIAKFNSHRTHNANTGSNVHLNASGDTINVVAYQSPSVNEYLFNLINQFRTSWNFHVLNTTIHNQADVKNQFYDPVLFNVSTNAYDLPQLIHFVNSLYYIVLDHLQNTDSHDSADYATAKYINDNITSFPAYNLSDAYTILTVLRDACNSHALCASSGSVVLAHGVVDESNLATTLDLTDPLIEAITLSNELLEKISNHIDKKSSHLKLGSSINGAIPAILQSMPVDVLSFGSNSTLIFDVDGDPDHRIISNLSQVTNHIELVDTLNASIDAVLTGSNKLVSLESVNGDTVYKIRSAVIPYDNESRQSLVRVYSLPPLQIASISDAAPGISIECVNHGLASGDVITISDVVQYNELNGKYAITVIDADNFVLDGTTYPLVPVTVSYGNIYPYSYTYESSGPYQYCVEDVIDDSGTIQITVTNHGLFTGDSVVISDVEGTSDANGFWFVTKVDNDRFNLNGSMFAGVYTLGTGFVTINRSASGLKEGMIAFGDRNAAPAIATDELSVVLLANMLKRSYEIHRAEEGVHFNNDTVNVVTAPLATTLDSAITLLKDIKSKYNDHRIADGVHGNVAIIRFEAPSDGLSIIYEGLRHFDYESGVSDLTSSFSDDGGLIFNE